MAEALNEVVFDTTATKADLKELELRLDASIKALELKVELRIAELESRIMNRVGTIVAGSTALTIAILGALITLN